MTSFDETQSASAHSVSLSAVPVQKKLLQDSMAWLDCSDFHLLLPSQDIITLMPIQMLSPANPVTAELGFVDYDHHSVPIFGLSKAFQLQNQLTDDTKMIVLFKQQDIYFGLVARELTKISDTLKIFSVPVCMSSRKQPFKEFAMHQQKAAGISSAEAVFNLLRLRGVKSLSASDATQLKGVG